MDLSSRFSHANLLEYAYGFGFSYWKFGLWMRWSSFEERCENHHQCLIEREFYSGFAKYDETIVKISLPIGFAFQHCQHWKQRKVMHWRIFSLNSIDMFIKVIDRSLEDLRKESRIFSVDFPREIRSHLLIKMADIEYDSSPPCIDFFLLFVVDIV